MGTGRAKKSQLDEKWSIVVEPSLGRAPGEEGDFSMSIVSQTASAATDGIGVASTAGDHLDAVGHSTIVDALGQESVDRLLAGAKAVVDGATGAAQAMHESIKFESIGAKAEDLMAAHDDAGDVTDQSVPESIDVDKLRDGTTKLQAVVAQAHELADTIEQILGDDAVMNRAREHLGASDEEADLEVVKGALASVRLDNVGFAGQISGVLGQVSAAGSDLPPDLQEAVQHLEESVNDSLGELARLIDRLRDMSIAAVDRLA